MQRILVMGPPGAGKSTFARKLAGITGLPLFHLDQEYWQPDWVPVGEEELQRRVRRILEGERWIIDGNYGDTMAPRLARADTLFILDLPRWKCLLGALRRRLAYRGGRTREDMAEGCPEKLDWEFVRYIWRFTKDVKPRNETCIAEHGRHLKVYRARSYREAEALLKGFTGAR